MDVSLLVSEMLLFLCSSLIRNQLGFNYPQDGEGTQLLAGLEYEKVYFTNFHSAGHNTQLAACSQRDFGSNELCVKSEAGSLSPFLSFSFTSTACFNYIFFAGLNVARERPHVMT